MPPSLKELKKRLVTRGTDNKDKILERFKIAYQEILMDTVKNTLRFPTINFGMGLISKRLLGRAKK